MKAYPKMTIGNYTPGEASNDKTSFIFKTFTERFPDNADPSRLKLDYFCEVSNLKMRVTLNRFRFIWTILFN